MSLRELSRASGISVSRLSLYERGEVRLPDHDLATMSAILKGSLAETPTFATDEQLTQYLEAGA
jgi:transcriptional regulator with XRE-family HTH domain